MTFQEFIDYGINAAVKIGIDYNKTLDFSDESIHIADEILDGYHDRYIHPEKDKKFMQEKIDTFAHIFGIYVGEVLRRNHAQNCVWKETEYGAVLTKDDGDYVNSIAKVYKQIANGKEFGDDIKSFFDIAILVLQGRSPMQDKQ